MNYTEAQNLFHDFLTQGMTINVVLNPARNAVRIAVRRENPLTPATLQAIDLIYVRIGLTILTPQPATLKFNVPASNREPYANVTFTNSPTYIGSGTPGFSVVTGLQSKVYAFFNPLHNNFMNAATGLDNDVFEIPLNGVAAAGTKVRAELYAEPAFKKGPCIKDQVF